MYVPKTSLDESIEQYLRIIQPVASSDRLSIIFYSFNKYNVYAESFPVNLLRNVGIRTVTTSHFLMLDMDMWVNGRNW